MDHRKVPGGKDAENRSVAVLAASGRGAVVVAVGGLDERAGSEAVGATGLGAEVVDFVEISGAKGSDFKGGAASGSISAVC